LTPSFEPTVPLPSLAPKRRILFVDDEQAILDGLRNRLRRKRDLWDMHFALGGKEALVKLADSSFDVLVTDMRMPGMDGATLLKEVQVRYPDVVRIVLSGHAEFEAALRAVPVAHQFIAKPCDPGVLENVVERACQLQKLVSDAAVRAIVGRVSGLPAMPHIYSTLRRMLLDEHCAMSDIAAVIKQDASIAAKLLQLVNSAFFRLSRPLSRIEDVVGYLGLEAINRLVLAGELFDGKGESPEIRLFLRNLQRHSVVTATIASQLMTEKRDREDAFVAALLHDIGHMLMAVHLPEHHRAVIHRAEQENQSFHAVELSLFGVTHAEVGAYLLGIWGLPYFIVEAVANHHEPSRVGETKFGVLGAVHVSNALAHVLLDEAKIEPDWQFLERIGLTDSWPVWLDRFGDEVTDLNTRLANR
jgi:putative nucleotidyltransferase with HDIG domain